MTSLVTVGTRKNARKGISVENVKTLTTAQTPKAARKGTQKMQKICIRKLQIWK